MIQCVKKTVGSTSCKGCIQSTVPASYWLRKYKWKNDFIYDAISGLTVAIMHIPQGMAYALLGNVTPVVGIYMALFPVLMYFFFGTSKHVSMGEPFSFHLNKFFQQQFIIINFFFIGTFAVVCLMTGKAVTTYSTPDSTIKQYMANNTIKVVGNHLLLANSSVEIYSPMQVATAITFTVGIFQVIFFVQIINFHIIHLT